VGGLRGRRCGFGLVKKVILRTAGQRDDVRVNQPRTKVACGSADAGSHG
jgi:hypothetical protein